MRDAALVGMGSNQTFLQVAAFCYIGQQTYRTLLSLMHFANLVQ